MVCRIFRKAHGRSCSQKRLLWRGITLLSGAQTDLAYREINTLPQSTRFQRLPLTIRFPPAAPRRYSAASFFPPESCRGFPTDDVGQFWRTETGRFWSAPKSQGLPARNDRIRSCLPRLRQRRLARPVHPVRGSLRNEPTGGDQSAVQEQPGWDVYRRDDEGWACAAGLGLRGGRRRL